MSDGCRYRGRHFSGAGRGRTSDCHYSRLHGQAEVNYYNPERVVGRREGSTAILAVCVGTSLYSAVGSCRLEMFLAGPNLVGQQARRFDFLGEFDFKIAYRPEPRH